LAGSDEGGVTDADEVADDLTRSTTTARDI
jgi:hypothetical protein